MRSDSIDRDFERERKEAEQLREREREMHHRYNPHYNTPFCISTNLSRARVYPLFRLLLLLRTHRCKPLQALNRDNHVVVPTCYGVAWVLRAC